MQTHMRYSQQYPHALMNMHMPMASMRPENWRWDQNAGYNPGDLEEVK